MPDHPLAETPPESLRRLTLESLDRAFGYRYAAHSQGLLVAKYGGEKKAIMQISEKLVDLELEKELDRLVHYWTGYREVTK